MQRKHLLWIASAALVVLAASAAFVSPDGAWPLTALAIFCMFFAEIERFKSLTLGTSGVGAELQEAKKEVEDVVKLNARIARDLIYQTDQFWGFSDEKKADYMQQLAASLKRMGVSDAEVQDITQRPGSTPPQLNE